MEQIFPPENNFKTLQENSRNLAKPCMRGRITTSTVLAVLFWCSPGAGGLCKCIFLAGAQLVWVQVLFCKAAFWLFAFQAWGYSSTGTGLCTSLWTAQDCCPFLHLFQALWVSSHPSGVWITPGFLLCKAAGTALCALSQVTDEHVKYHWPSELTTAVWPLAGLVVMPLTESFEPGRSVFSF